MDVSSQEPTLNWIISVQHPSDGMGVSQYIASLVYDSDKSMSEPITKYTHQMNDVYGIPYPPWLYQKRWDYLQSVTSYRSDDILVVTYPKCGTTWIEQVVLLLLANGDCKKLNPAVKNTYRPGETSYGKLWIESAVEQDSPAASRMGPEGTRISLEEFNSAPSRRVIKSHAPAHMLLGTRGEGVKNLPDGCKCVVVTRNPLDACVSSYYHAFNPCKSGWPFAAWAAMWLSGNVPHGSWFDWIKGWRREALAHPDRVLWLQFENIKVNPADEIRKVAQFLGIPHDDEVIAKVAEGSCFEAMKSQAESATGGEVSHLRKGTTGDWRNHFTATLLEEFKAKYDKEMGDQDLKYIIDCDAQIGL